MFHKVDVSSHSKKLYEITENSKILEIYFGVNSFLIKMQFFSIIIYFLMENEIIKISSEVSFKLFVKFF